MSNLALVNLPGRQPQKYMSWKGSDPTKNITTNSAVPTNSFPQPDNNGSKIYTGKANPIKHWRKQLIPAQKQPAGKVTVGQVMDRPGGSVYLVNQSSDCSNNPHSIKNYLSGHNPREYIKSECIPRTENLERIIICNPQRITRPGSTILKKNYYTTSKAYLKSRVKLYEQNQTITPIKNDPNRYYTTSTDGQPVYVYPSNNASGSQVYNSTYCSDVSCNNGTNTNQVRVIYKPSNYGYSQEGAVSSDQRIANIKKQTINNSAKSLVKDFGQYTANAAKYRGTFEAPNTLKSKYEKKNNRPCLSNQTQNSRRQPSGGSGNHTVCTRTSNGDIIPSLSGTVLTRLKGTGGCKMKIPPQLTECDIALAYLRQQSQVYP